MTAVKGPEGGRDEAEGRPIGQALGSGRDIPAHVVLQETGGGVNCTQWLYSCMWFSFLWFLGVYTW